MQQTIADVVIGSVVLQELTLNERHIQSLRARTQRQQGWFVGGGRVNLEAVYSFYILSLDRDSTHLTCLGITEVYRAGLRAMETIARMD